MYISSVLAQRFSRLRFRRSYEEEELDEDEEEEEELLDEEDVDDEVDLSSLSAAALPLRCARFSRRFCFSKYLLRASGKNQSKKGGSVLQQHAFLLIR
jgi:hypothetical protein